jgi:hypothetical protein
MADMDAPFLNAGDLVRIAREASDTTACEQCARLRVAGWESTSATLDESQLRRIGTLIDPADEEPTLDEHHPDGTHYWSAEAPIAPRKFPYNRCDVWQCVHCSRSYLRYTEYGGYYIDQRLRALDERLIVDA